MTATLFDSAIIIAGDVVKLVRPEDMHKPTPCTEWDVQALLNHMLYELAWVPELCANKTAEEVGDALEGDLVAGDVQHSWHAYAETARQSAEQTPPERVVHLSSGNVPASNYLDEVAGDIIVHTWDLARGIGRPFHIDEDVAKTIYKLTHSKIPVWREKGLIGPELPVAAGASAETKLLAMFGRKA
jgi:uncharacterized protein (TIGR03086 family)